MNLIDKDKLIDAFKEKQDCFVTSTNCMHTGGRSGGQKLILDIIQSLPVIEERKHGHWRKNGSCSQ